jgi:formylglycine-generating enzyme required for sulfatase activity
MATRIFIVFLFALQLLSVWATAQMVTVPAGSFMRGSNRGEPDEAPQQRIHISAFSIDAREVSALEYQRCVEAGRCSPARYNNCLIWSAPSFRKVSVPQRYRGDSLAVVCVSWQQARQYCAAQGKRLPTEAEWEYAAGAGLQSQYSWGNQPPTAQRCTAAGVRHPLPPGSFAPNRWGLYDMTGNVWEWVDERYNADYYTEAQKNDPRGPDVGRYRVIRGGGWYSAPAQLRLTNRHWFSPTHSEASIGFRCAR